MLESNEREFLRIANRSLYRNGMWVAAGRAALKTMTAIKVDKLELIRKLTENREKHRAIFLEASEGYRTAAIAELDSMLADAKAGKTIRRSVTLVQPMDQTKDYDRALQMLAMSVEDAIVLEESDFRCYVLDEWNWKAGFSASNIRYSKILQDAGEN